MGAKKKPSNTPGSDEEDESVKDMLKNISLQLNTMNGKMDSTENEVKGLRVLFEDLKQENSQLKTTVKEMDRKLNEMNRKNCELEVRFNNLEQHHRGWSARFLNIPVSEEEERNPDTVIERVYNLALLPILRGAHDLKQLKTIPAAAELLEVAHVLPAKPGETKPIIARFYNRNIRDLCFRLKKDFATREEGRRNQRDERGAAGGRSDGGGGFEGRGKYCFPFYEDLTRATFLKMRAIAKDEKVKACWSTKGQIKFVLHSNPAEVKKVVSILDPLDMILK
jgi:FtsZ-binding cell division protein ZapB